MSKIFELLQSLGFEEDLSQTSGEPTDAAATSSAFEQLGLAPDEQEREKILNLASLPSVFDTPAPPPVANSQSSPAASVGEPRRVKQTDAQDDITLSDRETSVPALPHADDVSFRHRTSQTSAEGNGAHSSSGSNVLEEKEEPFGFPSSPTFNSNVGQGQRARRSTTESKSPAVGHWRNSLRAGASSWKQWSSGANHDTRLNKADLEDILREEELKLVQRVFPQSGTDLRRIALFSTLEESSSQASICGRAAEILAARRDGPVCAVDANFQSPSLHRYFGTEGERGLAEAALGSGAIHDFVKQVPEPDLWLLPAGKAAAGLNFHTIAEGLRLRIMELRSAFRYVVIHAGPFRLQTIPMLISRWTDGVVLILEANSTPRDSARRVTEMLRTANVSLLGVVLNNRTFPIPDPIYRRL